MSDPTSKADWLEKIERARATWEELVSKVGAEAVEQPGAIGDWTFKDVAGHLNAWRELTVARLEAAAGDKRPPRMPWPDGMSEEKGVEEINQWFHSRNLGRPAKAILTESGEQFRRIRSAVEAIPDSELEARYPWLDGYPISAVIEGMLEHFHIDHEPGIRAWLSSQTH